MTVLDAKKLTYRAGAIWGHRRILGVYPRTDGGMDITCLRLGRGSLAGIDMTNHQLDAQGAPVCHPDCREHALTVEW